MGSMVRYDTHDGFKGSTSPGFYTRFPYYGDSNTEVVFNALHLLNSEVIMSEFPKLSSRVLEILPKRSRIASRGSLDKIMQSTNSDDEIIQSENSSMTSERKRRRSYTIMPAPSVPQYMLAFHKVTENDCVMILWLNEHQNIERLLLEKPEKYAVMITIYPLPLVQKMYLLKVYTFGIETMNVKKG
jgi:hypothetical protein